MISRGRLSQMPDTTKSKAWRDSEYYEPVNTSTAATW